MPRLNDHYLKLRGAYLFPEIDRRMKAYVAANPDAAARIIKCGIGDVTEPLCPAVRDAMHIAVDEMGERATFRGYAPPLGYDFLREAIAKGDFADYGLDISADEIVISDGSKTDCGAILDIVGPGTTAVPDPVYPVYVDTNVMCGRTGPARDDGSYEGLVYLPCTAENGFVPAIPDQPLNMVYLCFPNNPTGGMIRRDQLQAWVDWALEHDALILYDVAYQSFIRDTDLPRSIYEIDGARRCAMEFHSFSKNGGFTGVRCGYTVCPRDLMGTADDGSKHPMMQLWARRWSTKSNSVGYVVQRAAARLYADDGREQVAGLIDHYLGNAALLREGAAAAGLTVFGGDNAPYVWIKCLPGQDSWSTFETLLNQTQIIVTPGVGFGRCGEGYFRISAFNSRENVEEVVRRLAAFKTTA